MHMFSLSVKNIHVLDTSPKGRGNFIEEQHLTPRREVKTYAYTTMSDCVGAGGIRENIGCLHFVTQTERQKVADCRADGWTAEGGSFWGTLPGRLFDQIFFTKKFDSGRYSGRCVRSDNPLRLVPRHLSRSERHIV